jgi:hypothetical protein
MISDQKEKRLQVYVGIEDQAQKSLPKKTSAFFSPFIFRWLYPSMSKWVWAQLQGTNQQSSRTTQRSIDHSTTAHIVLEYLQPIATTKGEHLLTDNDLKIWNYITKAMLISLEY